jgi:hypothetical protein
LPQKTIAYDNEGWWDGQEYDCNSQIIKWRFASLGYYIAYYWYESDGGSSITINIGMPATNIGGISLPSASIGTTIKNDDDPIGTSFVDYGSANGQSFDPTGTGKFTFWIAYR